jgi:hypothetical protein
LLRRKGSERAPWRRRKRRANVEVQVVVQVVDC